MTPPTRRKPSPAVPCCTVLIVGVMLNGMSEPGTGVADALPTGVWSHRERLGVSPGAPAVTPAGVSSHRLRLRLGVSSGAAAALPLSLASSHSPPRSLPAEEPSVIAESRAGSAGSATSHRFRRGVWSTASTTLSGSPSASVPSCSRRSSSRRTRSSSRSISARRILSTYDSPSPPSAPLPNASDETPASRSKRRAWYSD